MVLEKIRQCEGEGGSDYLSNNTTLNIDFVFLRISLAVFNICFPVSQLEKSEEEYQIGSWKAEVESPAIEYIEHS